jgi:hypothetical protein
MEQIQSINKSNNAEPCKEKQLHEGAQKAKFQMHISSSKCNSQAPKGQRPEETRKIVEGSPMAPPSVED